MIEIIIKKCTGNKVKWDYDSDGRRTRRLEGFTPRWKNAKFRLPSGKPKTLSFPFEKTSDEILAEVQKRYSNFKFTLTTELNTGEDTKK